MKDRANAAWDKTKGKVNEKVGELRNDPAQELKGHAQQAKGDVERGVANLKDKVRDDDDV